MAANGEDSMLSENTPLLASQDAVSNGSFTRVNGCSAVDEEAPKKGDLDTSRAAQFQGLPDAQKRLKYIVPAVSIGVFLSAADQTIIVASYGKIGSDLKALNLTSWIAASYFLSLTSFQPLYGRLSDIFGRKACLLFAYAVFGLGCVFCGLARDIKELIAARVFQGIGGGGMTTVVSILLSDIVPLRDRGIWQGVINIIYATGSGLGAPLGGFMTDSIGWRWAFLAQGPLCLAAFVTVAVVLELPAVDESHWKEKLKRIDFLGATILVLAVFSFLLGLDRGTNVSWMLPLTIVSLVVSAVLFAGFVCVEIWVALDPFAPGHIIFERSMLACYFANFFSFGSWLSAIFYLPLFFQARDGVSATGAGLRLLPCIIAGVSGSLGAGIFMRKTGKYYWVTISAYILLLVGLVVIYLFSGPISNNIYLIVIGMVMCGFGNGIGVTTTLIGLSSVIGVSLASGIVQQTLRSSLQSALRDNKDIDSIVDGVRQSLDYLQNLDPRTRGIVRACYGHATNISFGFMAIVGLFTVLSAAFIREQKLSG
ncbi:conserved hypothetical protein [Uncinocarpus reesii 1704]|uniref:Major facilitator superfamily (MFS) profile domain-containing protein n=1 Tax=Uncinocarpus reesii (strain UAMH 1704) TaxID=336963 RepID=C4JF86_UNCRE|nr:uncharacterized protein UREG_02308 [Uncinocarpus reesii 1704]EEP77459.1 conserved hypothetical protein [Uncinocarpus reesii 1704]